MSNTKLQIKKNILCITLLLTEIIYINTLTTIQGKVITTPFVNDNRSIVPTLKSDNLSVELFGQETKMSFVHEDGSFIFHNVEDGSYTITVNDEKFEYERVIVEVNGDEVQAFQRNFKTGKGFKVKYPLQIKPISNILFEEENQNVVSSLLKSPYMIVIGMTVMMFLCMQMVPQDQLQEEMKKVNKQMHQYTKGNFANVDK